MTPYIVTASLILFGGSIASGHYDLDHYLPAGPSPETYRGIDMHSGSRGSDSSTTKSSHRSITDLAFSAMCTMFGNCAEVLNSIDQAFDDLEREFYEGSTTTLPPTLSHRGAIDPTTPDDVVSITSPRYGSQLKRRTAVKLNSPSRVHSLDENNSGFMSGVGSDPVRKPVRADTSGITPSLVGDFPRSPSSSDTLDRVDDGLTETLRPVPHADHRNEAGAIVTPTTPTDVYASEQANLPVTEAPSETVTSSYGRLCTGSTLNDLKSTASDRSHEPAASEASASDDDWAAVADSDEDYMVHYPSDTASGDGVDRRNQISKSNQGVPAHLTTPQADEDEFILVL